MYLSLIDEVVLCYFLLKLRCFTQILFMMTPFNLVYSGDLTGTIDLKNHFTSFCNNAMQN